MRGYVTVDTAEQFQAWMDAEQKKLKEGGGEDDVWGVREPTRQRRYDRRASDVAAGFSPPPLAR